jgi:hypothetical protein
MSRDKPVGELRLYMTGAILQPYRRVILAPPDQQKARLFPELLVAVKE